MPLQYRMFGQDFVVDLLGLLYITTPLCELMVLSQSVDFLHWKIVFWGQRMVSWINWLLPHIGNNTDNLVEGIAQKYLESHNSPMLRDPRSIRNYMIRNNQSKVIHRIKNTPCTKVSLSSLGSALLYIRLTIRIRYHFYCIR